MLALQAMWILCYTFPKYLIRQELEGLISRVFELGGSRCIDFLRFLCDYLTNQQIKSDSSNAQSNVVAIMGNSDSLADIGIASAVVQRYLSNIIGICLGSNPEEAVLAYGIVSLAAEFGLVHPISCIPALCALASRDNAPLGRLALGLHFKLSEKYSSFIHSKNAEGIAAIYNYHKSMITVDDDTSVLGNVHGNLGYTILSGKHKSLLDSMYSVQKTTTAKKALLKLIVKCLTDSFDIQFVSFCAEGLATLFFQSAEEIQVLLKEFAGFLPIEIDKLQSKAKSIIEGGKLTADSSRYSII
jgi:hypothetical protein